MGSVRKPFVYTYICLYASVGCEYFRISQPLPTIVSAVWIDGEGSSFSIVARIIESEQQRWIQTLIVWRRTVEWQRPQELAQSEAVSHLFILLYYFNHFFCIISIRSISWSIYGKKPPKCLAQVTETVRIINCFSEQCHKKTSALTSCFLHFYYCEVELLGVVRPIKCKFNIRNETKMIRKLKFQFILLKIVFFYKIFFW